MGTNENTQEMTETRGFDLPREDFQLTDHPWLAADLTVDDEIRYALDEIRMQSVRVFVPAIYVRVFVSALHGNAA